MPIDVQLEPINRDSLGLRVMLAALLAMALVLALTFGYQSARETDGVRAKGVNLARLITKLPPGEQQAAGWEQVFLYQLSDASFAYGAILHGTDRVVEVVASGVILPVSEPLDPNGWVAEAAHMVGDREVIEYHGPLRIGEESASFRIGFYQPSLSITVDSLPFVASLILPVFMLAPLFLFFVKREVNPLKKVNAELSKLLPTTDIEAVNQTGSDLRGVVKTFNVFVDQAKGRMEEYQAEKSKLVTSERFLGYRLNRSEAVLNSLPYGVLVLDQGATVSFANARVKPLLDLEPNDLAGENVATCLSHPELLTHFAKHAQNIAGLVGESIVFNPEHRVDLSLSATVHRLQGAEDNHLVIFSDVSQEVRAQQSRSEFVAHLAHELKAPLHTLSMYSEALQDEAGCSDEFQLEATNVINDEIERLARLINNLLSMTRIEMGTMTLDKQRIKLVELVRDAAEAMERSARGRDLTFELDLPNEVMPVLVDKDLLRIAINNLLTNAIKYTDAGGTISISVSENDDAVTICVADTGIGIPEQEQTQIFHKFYRASGDDAQSRGGHGLGLPLARDIVEMHHGSIRVESEPGEGSRFYIDLWKRSGIVRQAI
jgi:signal transduction histidine kinase